jgi:hypothetical protein
VPALDLHLLPSLDGVDYPLLLAPRTLWSGPPRAIHSRLGPRMGDQPSRIADMYTGHRRLNADRHPSFH